MTNTWKSAFEAAGLLALQIEKAMANRSQLVKSDDGEWVVEVSNLGVLTLMHETSQTMSVAILGIDNRIAPESYRFLGYRPESGRERKSLPDETAWEQKHRRMMGFRSGT